MEITKQLDILVKLAAVQYLTDEDLLADVEAGELTMEEAEENALTMAAEDLREYLQKYIIN